ncbi:Protein of uncharacterised function (DUF2622) [Serratia rubidaea]|uniref:Protein of uncharacterized function (DUF2622) n=1 Tax=Serratia rubidaea TaxID=61652 RepID=A0A447QTF8_SERRU|nr:Protein of uncharacterised function (DUF2622) [Serratia rubidaea]
MSQSATTCFVVTFHYQEAGLTDLAKLTGQLTREGFTTTVVDENGFLTSWAAIAMRLLLR